MSMLDAWGSPPGLRPTPTSAIIRITAEPDQGSGADAGVRPTQTFNESLPV